MIEKYLWGGWGFFIGFGKNFFSGELQEVYFCFFRWFFQGRLLCFKGQAFCRLCFFSVFSGFVKRGLGCEQLVRSEIFSVFCRYFFYFVFGLGYFMDSVYLFVCNQERVGSIFLVRWNLKGGIGLILVGVIRVIEGIF